MNLFSFAIGFIAGALTASLAFIYLLGTTAHILKIYPSERE